MTELELMTPRTSDAPICTGEASPLRVATGDNANWGSKVRCRRSPARTNRRRDGVFGVRKTKEKSPALPLNQACYHFVRANASPSKP